MKKILLASLFAVSAILLFTLKLQAQSTNDSVVRVFVTHNTVNHYLPWQYKGSEELSGTGFIISGNRILTNAHVVNDATFIQVRKESDPKKYIATIEALGEDCDLAILKVSDNGFFTGVNALEFGDLPYLEDAVSVIGYPIGGNKISITQGVISRIELTSYASSGRTLLGVQLDAAINLGNSGGPVIKDGKVVGVAMQNYSDGQSMGYMIPTPIIDHFLEDLKDDRYDGFPALGVEIDSTENAALRTYYGAEKYKGGVLVTNVVPFSAADGVLKEGDFILELDGTPVADDCTYEFRQNDRLSFVYLVQSKQVGQNMELKVLRDKAIIKLSVKLAPGVALVRPPYYYEKPPYYIYGGLVFTVLSSDLISEWQQFTEAPLSFQYYYYGTGRLNAKRKKEIVVLLQVLPDEINVGYQEYGNVIIDQVNGKGFDSFKEFVNLVQGHTGQYTVFDGADKERIIIANKDIEKISQSIIERNNIPQQYFEGVVR
nr:periplasmic serine endoprotease of the DegP/Htr family [uncultured bacterium]